MSIKSWHDSDEVDSDLECEAYHMLYYDIDKRNLAEQFYEYKSIDFEKLSKIRELGNEVEYEKDVEENIVIMSDSDEKFIEKKNIYSEKIPDLTLISSLKYFDCEQVTTPESSFDSNIINTRKNYQLKPSLNNINTTFNTSKFTNWSVDAIDTQPKLKSRSRYFDTGRNSVCVVCLKKGHCQSECTRNGPVCILCGKEGHTSAACDDLICYICFQTNHTTKKCPYSGQFIVHNCHRCGQCGHNDQICPDIWRQYKYTLDSGEPIITSCSSQNRDDVFCANCSRMGHFTEQCSRNRMTSGFLGPAPIVEVVRFDVTDIYRKYGISYIDPNLASTEPNIVINELVPEFNQSSNNLAIGNTFADFGDGCIMLNHNVKSYENKMKNNQQNNVSFLPFSGPRHQTNCRKPIKINGKLIDSTMPILPESLLKKLFPEETRNFDKIAPALRTKLRKKLKTFLKNGYLPGDSQITQDRMDFWLQEISTGRILSYRERKKLLCSVSAALHSISDRVSDVTIELPPAKTYLRRNMSIVKEPSYNLQNDGQKWTGKDLDNDDVIIDLTNDRFDCVLTTKSRKRRVEKVPNGDKKMKWTSNCLEGRNGRRRRKEETLTTESLREVKCQKGSLIISVVETR